MKSLAPSFAVALLAVVAVHNVSFNEQPTNGIDYYYFGSKGKSLSQPRFADLAHCNDTTSFKSTRCWWLDVGFVETAS